MKKAIRFLYWCHRRDKWNRDNLVKNYYVWPPFLEKMPKLSIVLFLLLLYPQLAFAQSQRNPCYNTGTTNCISVGTNTPLPVTTITSGGNNVTPSAPSGSLTLAAGGTAQNLFTAGEVVHGCGVQNPPTATENISVNFFTTAVGGAGQTAMVLVPGASITCPGGLTTAVSWIAATINHTINAYKW